MATTSLWRIKGEVSNAVRYIENPEKTSEGLLVPPDTDVSKLVAYVSREEATNRQQFVAGINCTAEHAVEEMQAVKRQFMKEDGTLAYHGYQSFREGELTPETAFVIGMQLANRKTIPQ